MARAMNSLDEISDRAVEYHFAPRWFFVCKECELRLDTSHAWPHQLEHFWIIIRGHVQQHAEHNSWA
mgnify:CR=1 FL=1